MKHIFLVIAMCCLVAGCATSRPIPVTGTLTVSEEEHMLWRRAQKEQDIIAGSGVLYQDAEIENYLNRIVARLQKNSRSPDIPFQIKVVNDPDLNAFAFPNGAIYIHTGILARMDNEAQLAALLAHEMAHCTHRHSLRVQRNIQNRTQSRVATSRKIAPVPGIAIPIASISRYTRELETEADRVGLDLMVKSNYDPREVLSLFELMKQEIESEGIEESYFFGSHPNVRQRIRNVNHWLAEQKRGRITGVKNTDIFQSRISRLVLDNARLDLRRGRFLVAQRTVEKFLILKPDDARAYFLLGEILRQQGRQDDAAAAIKYYERSISLNPSYPEPRKAMGLIHYKGGEKRLAKKYFESCLLLSPDTIDRAYIQEYLKLCVTNGEG